MGASCSCARAGRGDRLRRAAALVALSRRGGAPVRPGAALPRAVRAHPRRLPRRAARRAWRPPTTTPTRRTGCATSSTAFVRLRGRVPGVRGLRAGTDAAHRPGAARRDQRVRALPARPGHLRLPRARSLGTLDAGVADRRLPRRRHRPARQHAVRQRPRRARSWPGSAWSSRRPSPGVPAITPISLDQVSGYLRQGSPPP